MDSWIHRNMVISRKYSLMYLQFLIQVIIISPYMLCCAGTNTLYQSDTLNMTGTLVSNNKNFNLGFVKPISFSNDIYLTIWNSHGTPYNPVLLANRNTPITDNSSATLFIHKTGKLIINQTHGDPIQLCSPGLETTSNNTKAVLLDNGNLILIEVNSDGSEGKILWQSFDCPTDHLLPGMKLGINHRTGRNWSLTSWLAYGVPSPGAFTLEWDPHGLELVLKFRGVIYWTSGALKNLTSDGDGIRKLFGDKALIVSQEVQSYRMMYTKTSEEEFFTYYWDGKVDRSIDWIIDYEGSFLFQSEKVVLKDYCYGYKNDIGCAEWEQPKCRNHNMRFQLLSGNFVNKSSGNLVDGQSQNLSPADCRQSCWNDCDCQAYVKTMSMDCMTYDQHFEFKLDPTSSSPQFYVIQQLQNESKVKTIKVKISVPITLLLISVVVISIFYWRWKTKGSNKDHLHSQNDLRFDDDFSQDLKMFSFISIDEATDNFSLQNKLGEGGFGPVYKGKLTEGTKIAVKRLSRSSGQGLVEFKNELIVIAKLQHMNLVRLLGCCVQSEEKMLVYEYMPNGSLDLFLFDARKRGALNWRIRVKIIEGISQGLLYLHHYSRLRIIHRDLKPSNILLDEDMNPKISDFGMARIFKQDELLAKTNKIVGTYGYMSPEYAMDGIFSMKSDIFSLGVIILEILSGKRNNNFHDLDRALNLIKYVWDLWQNGVGFELMDPILLCDSCSIEQFLRFVHIGLLCVEECSADRPTTSEVISMITNESTLLPVVKKPAFTNLDRITNIDGERSNFESRSTPNNMSISTLNGR